MDSGETAGDSGDSAKEKRDYGRADRMRSVAAKHGGKTRANEETLYTSKSSQEKIKERKDIRNKINTKPTTAEEVETWVAELVAEGYDLSEFTWDEMTDIYLDEAEGSYGQTPKARQKMGDLANKRRNTPASEYSERGEKKKKVDSASRHFNRMGNPDAGNRGKKSSRPYYPAGRKGMTQKDRDWSRGADEYGHSGYDGEGGGGSLPKGKKLERQKKTGVSENYDLYDVILSHLLDEGYVDTEQAAEAIMVNMSEDWRESIVEEVLDEAGTSAMAPRGDYQTTTANAPQKQDPNAPLIAAKAKAAKAKVTKEIADLQVAKQSQRMKVDTNESVILYLAHRPDAFANLEEGVFDPKKSKMRSSSERSERTMTSAQRAAAKKEGERTAKIHSKGETVLAGLTKPQRKSSQPMGTTQFSKPAAPEANRKVTGKYDQLAKKASAILKSVKDK
jgi:hypothetical protein